MHNNICELTSKKCELLGDMSTQRDVKFAALLALRTSGNEPVALSEARVEPDLQI